MASRIRTISSVDRVAAWWSEGDRVPLRLGDDERVIFVRRMGQGPSLTLLHGYPASSFQWLKIAPALALRYRLLMADFLGFGASEKPRDHRYSLMEQADLIEALWAYQGIATTKIVAHDYGSTVAQELLARHADDVLAVRITDVTLMNGGIYPELHRRVAEQSALLDPETGPALSAGFDEQTFVTGLAKIFGHGYDAAADSVEMWRTYSHEGGQLNSHLLIHYITDREEHRDRWVNALEKTDLPLQFVWGLDDPVAGAHIAARIKERLPDPRLHEMPDVGHWPSIEAPERVIQAVLEFSA